MSDTTGEVLFVDYHNDGDALFATLEVSNIGQRESKIIAMSMQDQLGSVKPGHRFLVIDMGKVNFMNSMGIGMLIDARSRAAGLKLKTVLANVGDDMFKLLKMVRLDKVFSVCQNDKQLKKALKR
ncbi:MAG: STAS domain-containing protein [Phycisphaerales bacterium]|nr:STAS domain-containing protein [Phycisphaerales bacterium]